MIIKKLLVNASVSLAIFGLIGAPAMASPDKNKSRNKAGKHWNPAPPKKNGRHDNRDWNKNRNDDWRDNRRFDFDDEIRRQAGFDNLSYLDRESARRQQTKNEWRNIAIGAGAVAIYGLLKKDNRLVFAGAAGALYSLYRYEQDRKSQSQIDRLRAEYFSRPYLYRDGVRYDRRLVTKNGQKYYQFVRS